MRYIDKIKLDRRLQIMKTSSDGGWGYVVNKKNKPCKLMAVIWSDGGGWEHVSVSYDDHTPSWEDMCMVKEIFFRDDECVLQFHPPKADYINCHPYCLHMWRQPGVRIPMPPKIMVGV